MLPAMPNPPARFAAPLIAFQRTARNGSLLRATLAFVVFNAVELGEWTGILVYAFAATGPASVGLVAVLQLLPAAVSAPFTAGFGDRHPRGRVLVATYAAQAILIAAAGAAILLHASPAVVYPLVVLLSIAQTMPRPVQGALLPELAASPGELTAANAMASIAEGIGALAGPLALGIMLVGSGVGVAFVAGGAAMLLAALLVAGAALGGGPAPSAAVADAASPEHAPDGGAPDPLLVRSAALDRRPSPGSGGDAAGALDGLRAVASDPDMALVMALLAGRLLVYGGLEVLLVLASIELLGTGASGAGFLTSVFGAGIIAGGASTVAIVGRRRLAPWLGVGALVVGVQLLLIGVMPSAGAALVLLGIGGMGMAVIDVVGQTLLQRIAPDAARARILGVLEALLLVAEALGSFLVAPVVLVLGVRGALIAFGAALPLVALIAAPRFGRLDARVVIPAREIAVLERVSIFAPVSAAILELAARSLVRVVLPAGVVVIREGEPGDRFFVLVDGMVRVTQAGRPLRELGPGGSFGEIALLRDVPRTATVTALTQVELYALDREHFLAAVTGQPRAIAEALRVAEARLAGAEG